MIVWRSPLGPPQITFTLNRPDFALVLLALGLASAWRKNNATSLTPAEAQGKTHDFARVQRQLSEAARDYIPDH